VKQEAAVSNQDIRAALVLQRAELLRLVEQARSGALAIGDEPTTRPQDNMDDHVARLLHALDDVESALTQIEEYVRD